MIPSIRIIPARAGQTRSAAPSSWVGSDHPRACGANLYEGAITVMAPGSSPRVRGKLDGYGADGTTSRIIPARAGQTNTYRDMYNQPPDHPRACGANGLLAQLVRAAFGSSPRVRGKPRFGRAASMVLRIIPARAGQTTSTAPLIQRMPDHPRACGANLRTVIMCDEPCGSSPRVRGKRPTVWHGCRPPRIIPARAGQTPSV